MKIVTVYRFKKSTSFGHYSSLVPEYSNGLLVYKSVEDLSKDFEFTSKYSNGDILAKRKTKI